MHQIWNLSTAPGALPPRKIWGPPDPPRGRNWGSKFHLPPLPPQNWGNFYSFFFRKIFGPHAPYKCAKFHEIPLVGSRSYFHFHMLSEWPLSIVPETYKRSQVMLLDTPSHFDILYPVGPPIRWPNIVRICLYKNIRTSSKIDRNCRFSEVGMFGPP